jgi:anti-anti-sigma factor
MPLLTEGGMTLVLDCDDLTYMASSGLRVIQKAMRTLVPYKGEVKLINVNSNIYEVLEMTGFPQFMKIERKKG